MDQRPVGRLSAALYLGIPALDSPKDLEDLPFEEIATPGFPRQP
ncbi:uncharacterized protein CLUP02_12009 [Colletotrichum lupini]|uniref:Uncharacterized protein n=1 Tax=Colletotrichum lupini TaxID=145971 RepID=A0A9Q8T0B0_9PEZI|nr:uncharacterized protein CLUP02_12009 [Colletotrichum lupini]UQC86508.1 hypothetical protein CLUP02_12009 [Colletotrichum lupini]